MQIIFFNFEIGKYYLLIRFLIRRVGNTRLLVEWIENRNPFPHESNGMFSCHWIQRINDNMVR